MPDNITQTIESTDGQAAGSPGGRIWKFRPQELIALMGLLAYSNSLKNPFVFDSIVWIQPGRIIQKLWPIWDVFTASLQKETRPMVNLSLAVNYQISCFDPWSYHAFNAIVHVLAGLTLFAVLKRTLSSERFKGAFQAHAMHLAFVIAMIWTVHPLTTAAVTYTIQRAESMMGLFFLLTLYCAIRSSETPDKKIWQLLAVVACAAGMGSKQVMVVAPILVFAWDRIFAARSIKEIISQRWGMYVGLVASWAVIAPSVMKAFTSTGGGAGFALEAVTPIQYAASQFGVICHYLRLSLWPSPLVIDYAWPVARSAGEIVPYAIIIVLGLLATGVALWKKPAWGYLGLVFFLVLAPTSTILPIEDLAVEQRMYLPLAAAVTLVVMACYLIAKSRVPMKLLPPVLVVLIAGLAYGTYDRNKDYSSQQDIWQDVVDKRPENARGWYNLATVYAQTKRWDQAESMYSKAIAFRSDYAEAYFNLGNVLMIRSRVRDAETQYKLAVEHIDRIESKMLVPRVYVKLGDTLAAQGKYTEAGMYYRQALDLQPGLGPAVDGLARVSRYVH